MKLKGFLGPRKLSRFSPFCAISNIKNVLSINCMHDKNHEGGLKNYTHGTLVRFWLHPHLTHQLKASIYLLQRNKAVYETVRSNFCFLKDIIFKYPNFLPVPLCTGISITSLYLIGFFLLLTMSVTRRRNFHLFPCSVCFSPVGISILPHLFPLLLYALSLSPA